MNLQTPQTCGRVFIETYGCTFNVSDSEVMAGLLERAGYEIAREPSGADAVIINSCTVKDRTYLDFRKRVKELGGTVPALILAGCVPRVPTQSAEFSDYSQVGPDNLAAVPEVVERTLAGERVTRVGRSKAERVTLPRRRRNPSIEIVPISKGCLGACTFCQTVLARGRLHSFPEDAIIARIESAAVEGVAQVWLTSQDCGAYGLDCGTNLPKLMRRIARIPGEFKVRVGMANPDLIKMFLPQFADALADPRFFQFAHIPVQAGSDSVLRDMKRLYSIDDFRRICDALRDRMPHVTIATDIIAGFPTETDDDFALTLALIREMRIPVINRSRFSPRTGTSAARLSMLPSSVISRRSNELCAAAKEVSSQELLRWAEWEGPVIVEEHPREGLALARNDAYVPFVLSGNFAPGESVHVHAAGIEGFHLVGETACAIV